MLGENHSLVIDFPELEESISKLVHSDESFTKENKRYTELDKEIRSLEMRNAPIEDNEMRLLKQKRALLKDSLLKKLTNH